MGEYTIKYDRGKCIGAGSCVDLAPETWELDDDGLAKCKKTTFSEEEKEKNIKAAKSCPAYAIEVYGPDGEKLV